MSERTIYKVALGLGTLNLIGRTIFYGYLTNQIYENQTPPTPLENTINSFLFLLSIALAIGTANPFTMFFDGLVNTIATIIFFIQLNRVPKDLKRLDPLLKEHAQRIDDEMEKRESLINTFIAITIIGLIGYLINLFWRPQLK